MATAGVAPTKSDITPVSRDIYHEWQAEQKIPVIKGFFIEDINAVELRHWDLKGVPAAFVELEGTGGTNDAYICELPPGAHTPPQKHMYEEMVYVTQGHGTTTVWQADGPKHTFEWGPGSMFAIPLNASYQHFNASGREPARYYAVTNCCFVMNLFHSVDYVFNSDYRFKDRFDPVRDGYFSGKAEIFGRLFMTTNFVPDVRNMKLAQYGERGQGSTNMKFDLADNTMGAHVSEFPVGTYKKGHRHGPGAHVVILSGQGFSLLWTDEQKMTRVDWKPGSVVVPPDKWFHQHFNSGAVPARYLALRWHNWRYKFLDNEREDAPFTSLKEGGNQIEFEDENPVIHRDFEKALKDVGVSCEMGSYHPRCTFK